MSEQFKPGDRVRAALTTGTIVDHYRDDLVQIRAVGGDFLVEKRNLILVERADDPSKDPIGTVREDPVNGELFVLTAASQGLNAPWPWVRITGPGSGRFKHEEMCDDRVVGAVPGTLAATDLRILNLATEWYRRLVAEAETNGDEPDKQPEPGSPAAIARQVWARSDERPLWTGDGSEEPPAYVKKVRDESDGWIAERARGKWRWVKDGRGFGVASCDRLWVERFGTPVDGGGPYTEVRD